MSVVWQYPSELLFAISAHVYAASLPASASSLDPITLGEYGTTATLSSSMPPRNWPRSIARKTLANLCLVNRAWYDAAKPWLWHKIEVRLPRSWLSVLEEIAGGDDGQSTEDSTSLAVEVCIQAATKVALASTAMFSASSDEDTLKKWKESILETLGGPDGSIPPALLSPPASRDPSPRRLRAESKNVARWKIMRSIGGAVQNVVDQNEPGLYVPRLYDSNPGWYVQYMDFNQFRTIGMRRSVEESATGRFVTGERIQALLKEMPNLRTFGATEYMDSALTLDVLNELFLRGSPSRRRGRHSRGRGLMANEANDLEEEDRERRQDCKDVEAVDLTGCVSAVFIRALTEFVNMRLLPSLHGKSNGSEVRDRRDTSRSPQPVPFVREEPLTFSGMKRLSLRGIKCIQPHTLTPFVLAFPSLSHLDLSATRATPELLTALGDSSVRLRSLALARCILLTGESIKNFLIYAPAAARIEELTLYGDCTFPSPLSTEELEEIFSLAPCFTSGGLTYLDLSSAPITKELLRDVCKPQPKLRSLGLSYIPGLELDAIAQFILSKAVNVEVLTLISTSPDLDGRGAPRSSALQASIALHSQVIGPLCTLPYTSIPSTTHIVPQARTRLRVIELSAAALRGLGSGAGTWRIIRSKGARGWYVDTASGWVGSELKRELPRDHPLRKEMERLADANGNVSSGVGWHARKMEVCIFHLAWIKLRTDACQVLHGYGMLGREDGLYGAVSFAYQG
ncbi:hypothetical protein PAXRUDRAFT_28033 [Paxillus rubicundulus Ve08.2h10]|uniref:F-box domain-containing protein n=1 Tax=Paxillus rubicundulus Ve08.2h10 TaxID=930991 RepID=A0A0D0DAF8_9AGAM|nr:hypothetical protein PAXRUDRAFT_28033 [Paxillus rubicundulus Ve08.2h10]